MTPGLQPFLSDRLVALSAPTQVWSGQDGDLGSAPIDGVYHGDTRVIRGVAVEYAGVGAGASFVRPETIGAVILDARRVRIDALLRAVDDEGPDPRVRLSRERTVGDGRVTETLTVHSHLDTPLTVRLRVRIGVEIAPLQEVKAGDPTPHPVEIVADDFALVARSGSVALHLDAPAARLTRDDASSEVHAEWELAVPVRGIAGVEWSARMHDPALVVRGATSSAPWTAPGDAPGQDPRLGRWLDRALSDLDALRLSLPEHPEDEFFAAGAPWFFTLFGRDSLWAARLILPLDRRMAESTLRVLARLQGARADPATAEQPGKIMHELRAGTLAMPGEGIVLPPLYYGTVDATPLWVCLLVDAVAAGMPEDQVRPLLPHLEAALDWIRSNAGEDGFLEYLDETGHGLSNQGWKDSGDSIQWRDGTLAAGPIALCEVQGYAHEAAIGGADLLDRFGRPGGGELRAWAAGLKERFADRFWVTTPEGRYPAIALDRHSRPVDTLTTNAGHLLGTGILDPAEERAVADLLVGESVSSGFGLRTLSTGAAGYWPLSYHGGSVWTHDTAIVARGMAQAGLAAQAREVVDGMLAAAEAFEQRVPELHAGDDARSVPRPAPYPAACRPQAWSAAAAVTAWAVLGGSGQSTFATAPPVSRTSSS
ncbi:MULTISPECIES: glycogen debranching N-terminal domain-containing protein [unclassified Microbacterium]|uniref:glycogen debranching N-terminal domain-containing protein n=1 Tax=unclassified Microbacterium TaxID=2609290 RepID=UPI0030176C3B